MKKNSVILAVRKVPPGKISKLVHPDLHLENYTSYLLPVGVNQPIKAKKGGGKSSKPKRKSSCSKEEGALKSEPQSPSLIGSPFNSVENEQYRFTPPPKKLSKLESDEEYVEHCEKKEIGLQTDERCNTVSKETQTERKCDILHIFSNLRALSEHITQIWLDFNLVEFVAVPLLWDTRGRSAI